MECHKYSVFSFDNMDNMSEVNIVNFQSVELGITF